MPPHPLRALKIATGSARPGSGEPRAAMTAAARTVLVGLALAWTGAAASPPLQPPADPPPLAAQAVPPPSAAHLQLRITTALLKSALARDEGLGNALAQFVRHGITLSPPAEGRKGRLVFVPRPADALAAFIDEPSSPFPREPAPPPRACSAIYWLEPSPDGGQRLVVGLGDRAPPGQPATAPNRWFELTVVTAGDALTALAWRPLPMP